MPIAGEMFLPLDATKHAVTNPSRPMYFFLPQVLGVALGHLRSLRAGHELGAELVAGAQRPEMAESDPEDLGQEEVHRPGGVRDRVLRGVQW